MDKKYIQLYENLEENHWWWRGRRAILHYELGRSRHQFTTPPRLLDVGCGAGVIIKSLENQYECTGVEPDNDLFAAAVANTKSRIIKDTLPSLVSINDTFDIILLMDVLEHIKSDHEAMKRLSSLLIQSGILVINVPAHPSLWSVHDEYNEHFRRYTKTRLEEVARRANLRIIKLRYWGHLIVPPVFLARKFLNKNPEMAKMGYGIPPKLINSTLAHYLITEYKMLERVRIPWGLSLFAILVKE